MIFLLYISFSTFERTFTIKFQVDSFTLNYYNLLIYHTVCKNKEEKKGQTNQSKD